MTDGTAAATLAEMTRTQFAEVSLLSVKALRLYEERGLLVPARTDQTSGYRYYGREQTSTVRLIAMLREAGATLEEVHGVVQAPDPASAQRELARVEERLRRRSTTSHALLTQARMELTERVHREALSVTSLQLPDQVTLGVLDPVNVGDLLAHVARRVAQLEEHAASYGVDVVGAPFGTFHGPVDADSRGPLEVLLPVSQLVSSHGPVRCQRTQGGLFATTTVEGTDAQFPAVLAAYAAAGSWIDRHAHVRVGPPRELWQVDHLSPAAPIVVAVPYVPAAGTRDQRTCP